MPKPKLCIFFFSCVKKTCPHQHIIHILHYERKQKTNKLISNNLLEAIFLHMCVSTWEEESICDEYRHHPIYERVSNASATFRKTGIEFK